MPKASLGGQAEHAGTMTRASQRVPVPRAVQRLIWVLVVLTSLLFLGTFAFHWVEGWDLLDSLYMTLLTLTTVGYGEVHPLSRAGQVVASALMLTGVAAVFVGFGVVVDLIVKLEVSDYFGQRRRLKTMQRISGHYIVCGAGRVGRSVVRELLRDGVPVVVIDIDPDRLAWATELGVPVFAADATDDETLRRAQVASANGLVAATSSDADNVYVTLSAKVLKPSLVVVARAMDEEAAQKLRRAGASTVLTPYTFIGNRLAQSLLRPHVLDFFEMTSAMQSSERHDVRIEQVHIGGDSALVGHTLEESRMGEEYDILVLAISKSAGMTFNPRGDLRLQAGDVLVVMGERPSLKRLEEEKRITRAGV